eukprot:scaffold12953_cov123-Skeletonema_dohrnii-CCMP3373.AAC.2
MMKSGSGRRDPPKTGAYKEPVALAYSYQSPRRHGGASDPRGRYYPNISGSKRVFAQDVPPRRWEVDNNDYLDIAERALFDDDDIRDDESEESIKVLLRYCGCNQEGYGKCYQNSTCSFETAGTRLSYERSGDGSDLIESIRTIEEAADDNDRVVEDGTTINIHNDDGENVDGYNEEGYCCYQNSTSTSTCGNTTGSYDYETSKDDNIEAAAAAAAVADNNVDNNENLSTGENDDDLLPSPSGKLLMSAGENYDAEAIEMLDIAEGLSVEVSSSSNEGNVVVDDDEEKQLSNDELTPTDHQPDDTTPVVDQPGDEAPFDEQPTGNAPYDEQPDESAPIEPQAIQNKSGNIKRAQELMIRCNDHRHSIHACRVKEVEVDIPSRMSHSTMSPSVRGRQIALSLHDAPKYPTTKYVEKGDHNDKEVNTECTPTAVQGEKEGPVSTLEDSGALTNVEEMDMLIKSTRAWLETQKAERKVRLETQRAEWKAWENIQI